MRPGARVAWSVYLALGAALAVYAVVTWLGALVARAPVLYGEGAVANAARLARDGIAYLDVDPQRFVAANYPPLYLHVASLGAPFVVGRIASIVSTLGVAGLVFVSARSAGRVVAAALALGWLALAPVAIWGPAVKPDLVALFITVLAVVILDRRRDLAALAGFALIFAGLAKPTALLPAAALGAWLLWSDRSSFARFAFGAALAVIGAAAMISLDSVPDVWRHVVVWNELSWSAEQAGLLVVVGMLVLGVPAGLAALMGGFRGARAAYAAGALAVVVLGGREGATINYLLDATAAVALGLGALGPRLRVGSVLPALAVAQLAVGTLTLNPLSLVPGRPPTTGAWADPSRTDLRIAFRVDGRFLVEDSGLLVRAGITPVVDDLFLWSRLVQRGTVDGRPILSQIEDARIDTVISEVDLEHLASAPAYERQRWAEPLVRAVLDRYRLDAHAGSLWIYVPR